MPSFSDARVRDLLRAARQAGLKPRSDAELLPLLLRLIGAHIPVEKWPTRMTRTQRTEHAREETQAQAAGRGPPGRLSREGRAPGSERDRAAVAGPGPPGREHSRR